MNGLKSNQTNLFLGKETLFLICLSFTMGIGIGHLFEPPILIIKLGALILGCVVLGSLIYKKSKVGGFILLPFFLCIGLIHSSPPLQPPQSPHHIFQQIDGKKEASLIGILHEMATSNGETSTFIVKAEKIILPTGIKPTLGLVKLSMAGPILKELLPGDRLIVRATLSRLNPPTTPGIFDYRAYLAQKNIWIKGWISAPVHLAKINHPKEATFLHSLKYWPEKLRKKISLFLEQSLSKRSSGLYKAILLGDKSSVPPDLIENFKRAGVMHLLAISGLHMGLLALCFMGGSTWLLKRSPRLLLSFNVRKISAFFCLAPLTVYAMLAGFQIPVVRSLIMVTVFIIALIWDRQWSVRNNIAIACLLILLISPDQLNSASFQLSFSAVISIALFVPLIKQFSYDKINSQNAKTFLIPLNWLRTALLVSLIAMAGTFPLLLLHFNRFSPVGPFATLMIEPFLCFWSLLLGLTACLILPFSNCLANFFLQAGDIGMVAADHLTTLIAALPFSSVWLPTPTPLEIFLYYLGFVFLSQSKGRRGLAVGAGACLVLLAGTTAHSYLIKIDNTKIEIAFLDVGQGSSTLLKLPNGHAILIDCGAKTKRIDVGQRIVAPFLWGNRISKLDQIIITHPHADHYNGIQSLITKFRPRILWVNGLESSDPKYGSMLRLAEKSGTEIRIPQIGEILYENNEIKLQNMAGLHLQKVEENWDRSSINDKSLVVRLEYRDISVLFPGDISWSAEKNILNKEYQLTADVLLAAHHGGNFSNSKPFLEAVSPKFIIISGLPPDPSKFFKIPGANSLIRPSIFNTAEHGTICLISDGRDFKFQTNPTLPSQNQTSVKSDGGFFK